MRPVHYAALLSTVYVLTASLYIVLSGRVASAMASSVAELERIETYKGIGFVLFTALMLFALSLWLFERHSHAAREAERHRQAFLASERAATTGIFTASLAHDFNNILMVMLGSVYALEQLSLGAETKELVDEIDVAAQRGAQICQRLLSVTRSPAQASAELDLGQLVEEAIALIKLHHKSRRREVVFHSPGVVKFVGDAALLHQLVINLLLNALDASVAQISVTLELTSHQLILLVDDDGAGVEPALRSKLFDAFFTTKSDGTGLGLVSVKYCAEAHRGQVQVLDSSLGGACFKVSFPLSESYVANSSTKDLPALQETR